jgi:tetratricopeptide (TPR) repeat protein
MSSDSQLADYVRDNTGKLVNEAGDFQGTCFFIDVNGVKYCVTCHHCIWKMDKIYVEIASNEKYALQWLDKYSDPGKDIAIMSVDSTVQVNPLKHEPKALLELPVYVMGWPEDRVKDLVTASKEDDSILANVSTGIIIREETSERYNNPWNVKPKGTVNVLGFKGNYNLGLSGSPVCYKATNTVVGIFTRVDDYEHGYALPIQTLLQIFDKATVAPPLPNLKSSEYLENGNDYFIKKQYEKAIEQYDKVIRDLNYVNAMCNKGRALGYLGKLDEERKWYKKVLAIDPANIRALNGMAASLIDSNDIEGATEWIKKALEYSPDDTGALYNMGVIFHYKTKYKSAINQYDKVLAIDPNFVSALDSKALALARLEKYEDAISCIDKALVVDPQDVVKLTHKTSILYSAGKNKEALAVIDKALAIDPSSQDALYWKEFLSKDQNQY